MGDSQILTTANLEEQNPRKRKRKASMTPRFSTSTIPFELGLIRLSVDVMKEIDKELEKE